jgi:ATP-dependent Clp protease ATP-binding subunit ClpA
LGLLALGEGVGNEVLANLDVSTPRLQEDALNQSGRSPSATFQLGELPFAPEAKEVLQYSVDEAQLLNHMYIGTEHLLLGLLRSKSSAELLGKHGLKREEVLDEIVRLIGPGMSPNNSSQFLSFQQRLVELSLLPEVTGLLLMRKNRAEFAGRAILMILVKEGSNLDELSSPVEKILSSGRIPFAFKCPNRRPVTKTDGKWVEDPAFETTLTF